MTAPAREQADRIAALEQALEAATRERDKAQRQLSSEISNHADDNRRLFAMTAERNAALAAVSDPRPATGKDQRAELVSIVNALANLHPDGNPEPLIIRARKYAVKDPG